MVAIQFKLLALVTLCTLTASTAIERVSIYMTRASRHCLIVAGRFGDYPCGKDSTLGVANHFICAPRMIWKHEKLEAFQRQPPA